MRELPATHLKNLIPDIPLAIGSEGKEEKLRLEENAGMTVGRLRTPSLSRGRMRELPATHLPDTYP